VGPPDSVYTISKAGQVAVQNILAHIGNEELVSYAPQRAKWLSDMGDNGAAYLSEPQVPLRDINWMRQGRWVHLAKVDFEKYFINKIRLKPAGHAPSVASKIAGVMGRILTEKAQGQSAAAAPHSMVGTKPIEVHLARDPSFELKALARATGRQPDALAADLLAAALTDAKSYLGEAEVDALELARRELLVEELPERQPGVEFHGGGT
jgi:sulfide:quinone oxidoreductase